MDKDRVKGAVDDAAGRAKRQVGEWTDNTDLQVEGAAQQVKGKAEKFVGNVKDAARDASDDAKNAARDANNRDRHDNADNKEKYANQNPGHFERQGQGSGTEQHRNH